MTLEIDYPKLLTELNELSPHHKMLEIVSIITKKFEYKNIKPVIVGGLSVEIFTKNNYTTRDIDLVSDGREDIEKFLIDELNFIKEGRGWYNEDMELAIEIPSNNLEGSIEKIIKLKLTAEKFVYVIGLEDIIIHRLESAVATNKNNPDFTDDYEWAKRMFDIHAGSQGLIEMNYLASASKDSIVKKILNTWITDYHKRLNT